MRKEDLAREVRDYLLRLVPSASAWVSGSATPGRRLLAMNLPEGYVFRANQLQTLQFLYRIRDERGAEKEARRLIDLGVMHTGGFCTRRRHVGEQRRRATKPIHLRGRTFFWSVFSMIAKAKKKDLKAARAAAAESAAGDAAQCSSVVTISATEYEELQSVIRNQAARIKELELCVKGLDAQKKDLVDQNYRLVCQRDAFFETKETLRGAIASMANPFR
jgi:hypothetical protein